jgi:hypothetical protein
MTFLAVVGGFAASLAAVGIVFGLFFWWTCGVIYGAAMTGAPSRARPRASPSRHGAPPERRTDP